MKGLLLVTLLVSSLAWGRAPVVVIDPGHGGQQEGAIGPDGLMEKALALQIAQRLRAILVATLSAEVMLTRDRDAELALAERVLHANSQKPDLFISIHANSMPTQKQRERTEGIETFFLSASSSGAEAKKTAMRENAEAPGISHKTNGDTLAFILADLQRSEAHGDSSRLAYAVHQQLIVSTGAVDRGVQQAPFYVLMGVEAPAILVEVGFISHPTEGKRLAEPQYQEALAVAISEGLRGFWTQLETRDGKRANLTRP